MANYDFCASQEFTNFVREIVKLKQDTQINALTIEDKQKVLLLEKIIGVYNNLKDKTYLTLEYIINTDFEKEEIKEDKIIEVVVEEQKDSDSNLVQETEESKEETEDIFDYDKNDIYEKDDFEEEVEEIFNMHNNKLKDLENKNINGDNDEEELEEKKKLLI
jgi:hypothetical protein